MVWHSVSPTNRLDYVRMITRTEMNIDDSLLNLGSLGTKYDKGYYIDKLPTRELPYTNNFHNAITYELNRDKVIYLRRVYSFFDLLRDIGGLFSAIFSLCSILVAIL